LIRMQCTKIHEGCYTPRVIASRVTRSRQQCDVPGSIAGLRCLAYHSVQLAAGRRQETVCKRTPKTHPQKRGVLCEVGRATCCIEQWPVRAMSADSVQREYKVRKRKAFSVRRSSCRACRTQDGAPSDEAFSWACLLEYRCS
jgi:hypothetical protein